MPTPGQDAGYKGNVDFAGISAGDASHVPAPLIPTEGFAGIVDFTGVPVGNATVVVRTPTEGFLGLIDFTGVPVGNGTVPANVPTAGCHGFIDFTGIPCGGGVVTRHGKGKGHGGRRRLAYYLLEEERRRSILREARRGRVEAMARSKIVEVQQLEIAKRQMQLTAMKTIILSEI